MTFNSNVKSLFYLLLVALLFLLPVSVQPESNRQHGSDSKPDYQQDKDSQAIVLKPFQDTALGQSVAYQHYPITFHSIHIDYKNKERAEETEVLLRSLIKPRNELSRSTVKEVRVDGRDYYGNWTLVEAVFQSLHNLEDIHWYNDQPIPPGILASLETLNPSAKLHFYAWFDRLNHGTEKEIQEAINNASSRQSIVNSINLYSFTGHIDYRWEDNRQGDMGLIWQVLTTCPNIRKLDLTIGSSGCVVGAGQPYAFDFSSHHDASFPPLEVLKLTGYDLESTSNREWVKVPEYPTNLLDDETDEEDEFYEQMEVVKREQESRKSNRMNLEEWLDTMDWSKLHTLHLSDASSRALQLLSGPVLPSLKHLSLVGTYMNQPKEKALAHETFLKSTILPLESITLQGISHLDPNQLIKIISIRHSFALKHLKLTGISSPLTLPHISRLHTAAPNLETLDIDISRPLAHHIDRSARVIRDTPILSSLATYPSLKRLTLRFPSLPLDADEDNNSNNNNNNNNNNNRTPPPRARDFYGFQGRTDGIEDEVVNHTSVTELFLYLRARNAGLEGEDVDVDVDARGVDGAETGEGGAGRQEGRGTGIEELEVFVGDYEGRNQYGMIADRQCVLGHYVCRRLEGGLGCEGEAAQNAYYG